jgi:hypothetical protein
MEYPFNICLGLSLLVIFSHSFIALLLLILAVFSLKIGGYVIFTSFIVAYLITWLSINLRMEKKGDYSYGMYIYILPVQHFSELGFLRTRVFAIFYDLYFHNAFLCNFVLKFYRKICLTVEINNFRLK